MNKIYYYLKNHVACDYLLQKTPAFKNLFGAK
jgi:hypothetical protein